MDDLLFNIDASNYESLLRAANQAQQKRVKHAWVDAMPQESGKKEEDPLELIPDEAFAISTQVYQRDDDIEDGTPAVAPSTAPKLDDGSLEWLGGANPMDKLYRDFLNSYQRFDDMMIKQQKDADDVLNKNLSSDQDKLRRRRERYEIKTIPVFVQNR